MTITPDTKKWLKITGLGIILCMPIALSIYYQVKECMCY